MSRRRLLFLSESINPFFNLSFENWLIKDCHHASNSPDCLFIYRNEPSIIIGRNQNVWAECNVFEAKSRNIPILRRYSGGGTVYHDMGNVNYSLHRDKSLFSRTFGAEMIVKALRGHEPGLYLSTRHDIFLNSFKVSGSAYKLTRDRAYHHGTLLLSTDLGNISNLLKSPLQILKPEDSEFKFGGISSVPSPVTNIPNNLSFEAVVELIEKEFNPTEPAIRVNQNHNSNDKIEEYSSELSSWNWIFGKCPPFKVAVKDSCFTVEASIITGSASDDPLSIGRRFDDFLSETTMFK